MIDPMQQRLDAYHARAMQTMVPRFQQATVAAGTDGAGSVDLQFPGAGSIASGVGIAPSAASQDGLSAGWPVIALQGGTGKDLVISDSPWQVGNGQ